MAESFDPNSVIGSVRSSPKDIQQMANILKDMGVTEYEPRVLNQMLEFSYRYLTTILDDAYLYSTHAKKKCVDSDDVKLAINLYQDRVLATPPARDVILEVARQRNSMPLPQIKSSAGLRLPPDRHSLIACNYRLKSGHKKRVHTVSRLTQNSISSSLGSKSATLINVNKPGMSVLPKSSANLSSTISKPAVSMTKPAPTPIIKFSDGKSLTTTLALSPTVSSTANSVSQILMPTMGSTPSTTTQILMPTIGTSTASSNQLLMPSIGITTASGQLLMPTVGITSAPTPQIHMPTVGPTDIKLPNEGLLNKRELEEDDDYDME